MIVTVGYMIFCTSYKGMEEGILPARKKWLLPATVTKADAQIFVPNSDSLVPLRIYDTRRQAQAAIDRDAQIQDYYGRGQAKYKIKRLVKKVKAT